MKLLFVITLAYLCTACTFTSVSHTTPEGYTTSVTYFDLHPGGNNVAAQGTLEGLGNFSSMRITDESTSAIETVGKIINPIQIP